MSKITISAQKIDDLLDLVYYYKSHYIKMFDCQYLLHWYELELEIVYWTIDNFTEKEINSLENLQNFTEFMWGFNYFKVVQNKRDHGSYHEGYLEWLQRTQEFTNGNLQIGNYNYSQL